MKASNTKTERAVKVFPVRHFLPLPAVFILLYLAFFTLLTSHVYDGFSALTDQPWLYLPSVFYGSYGFTLAAATFFSLLPYNKAFTPLLVVYALGVCAVYTIQYFSLSLTKEYLMREALFHIDQAFLLVGLEVDS